MTAELIPHLKVFEKHYTPSLVIFYNFLIDDESHEKAIMSEWEWVISVCVSKFWYIFISLRQSSTDHIHTAAIFSSEVQLRLGNLNPRRMLCCCVAGWKT